MLLLHRPQLGSKFVCVEVGGLEQESVVALHGKNSPKIARCLAPGAFPQIEQKQWPLLCFPHSKDMSVHNHEALFLSEEIAGRALLSARCDTHKLLSLF